MENVLRETATCANGVTHAEENSGDNLSDRQTDRQTDGWTDRQIVPHITCFC